MSDFLVNQVFDGSLLAASLVALIAGLISFASPCVLPLLPGYLGYVSGAFASKGRVLLGSFLFVLGFAFLFMTYGVAFGALGDAILSSSSILARSSLDWYFSFQRNSIDPLNSLLLPQQD
jgi:cytochrome c-type biogenesis protein